MKKFIYKLLILTVIAAMVVTAMPLTGVDFSDVFTLNISAAEENETFIWGDYECKIINKNEIEIVAYMGADTEIVIPSEINGMAVTVIGRESFSGLFHTDNCENNRLIKNVFISSSVKTIENRAFECIDSLEKVTFSEGLTAIKVNAFNRCPLLTEIKLPDTLTTFEGTAFMNTGVEELVFGPNFETLDFHSFGAYNEQSSNVKKIIMTAENNYISFNGVQRDTYFLTEIVCNGKLHFINNQAPYFNLQKIVCNGSVEYKQHSFLEKYYYSVINETNGTITYSKNKIQNSNEKETNGFKYYLNDNNEAVISKYTGTDSNVIIPNLLDGYTVTSIATFAFGAVNESDYEYYDDYIPKTLIKTVTLPDTITHIGDFAFAGNEALDNINIPESLLEISDEGFRNCLSLKNIFIPESVNKLGYATFLGCASLESIVMNGVTEIGAYTFENCTSLKNIEFSEKLKTIGEFGFAYCSSIESVDLSDVEFVGSGAFYVCENLKKAVLNDKIEKLEDGVFCWCYSLNEVNLPKNIKIIGGWCFDSTAITEMIFPEGLKVIEESAFYDCKLLKTIRLPESIESIWCFAFTETAIDTLTIPENLKNLGYRAFWRCYSLTTLYFYAKDCKVTDHGVEYIPSNWMCASPFDECNIKNIYLGSSVTALSWKSMQYGTFENCTVLENVTIPDSVEVIGTAAFKNCTNLETAVIPDSVEVIADDAFVGCENLTIYCSEESYAYAYASARGISVSTFVISPISNQVYSGSAIKPALTVKVSNITLTKGVDYSVSYSNNINVGQATVVVQGKGDYDKFSSKANFTIVTKNISKVSVADIRPQKYTGKAIEPSLTVTDNGRHLKEGKDYTVYYYNNTNQGVANAVISGIGNYSGTVTTSFEITELGASDGFSDWFIRFITDSFTRIISFFLNYFNK